MLGAAHALAIDSKNLLDVVDAIRLRYPQLNKKSYQVQTVQNKEGASLSRSTSIEKENTNHQQNASYSPTPVSCTYVPYPMIEVYSQNGQQTNTNSSSCSLNPSQIIDS